MEVSNLQQLNTLKADESKKARLPLKPLSDAYKNTTASSDQVEVSDKAKLLLNLRDAFKKIDEGMTPEKIQNIQEKIANGDQLSSEEIVHGILRGTLFAVI